MQKFKKEIVVFYGIFLILFSILNEVVYSIQYESGTNVILKDIEFRLNIENSLLVAYDTEINFGEILKGSTGKILGESEIKVEAGSEIQSVTASYLGKEEIDGSYKITINYIENQERNQKEMKKKIVYLDESEEKKEIDVYFLPFDKSYELKNENGKNKGEIPVKAEIRGIGNAKLGHYEGSIQVQVIAITLNDEEKKRW